MVYAYNNITPSSRKVIKDKSRCQMDKANITKRQPIIPKSLSKKKKNSSQRAIFVFSLIIIRKSNWICINHNRWLAIRKQLRIMPKMKIKKSDLSFHVFCLFDLDSPSHADLGLSYRSIEIHILFWFFESPKWKLRIWRPKSISGIKTSQTVNRKKKPKSTLFLKKKKI